MRNCNFLRLVYNKVTSRSYGYFLKFSYFNFLKNWFFQLCQKLQSLVKKNTRHFRSLSSNKHEFWLFLQYLVFTKICASKLINYVLCGFIQSISKKFKFLYMYLASHWNLFRFKLSKDNWLSFIKWIKGHYSLHIYLGSIYVYLLIIHSLIVKWHLLLLKRKMISNVFKCLHYEKRFYLQNKLLIFDKYWQSLHVEF
jgi:hypothetical protein